MATEVFLMADVADLGAEGDVVTVADGYARNYLIPKQLGAPVTDATQRRLAKIQRDREETRAATVADAKALAKKLDKKQEKYHAKMMDKAQESQEYQQKIEDLNIVFAKKNQACSTAHNEMSAIRERAEQFHQDFLVALREIERIKSHYDIDFIEYESETSE